MKRDLQRLKVWRSQWRDMRVLGLWLAVGCLIIVGGLHFLETGEEEEELASAVQAPMAPALASPAEEGIYLWKSYRMPHGFRPASLPEPVAEDFRNGLEEVGIVFGPQAKVVIQDNSLLIYNTQRQQDMLGAYLGDYPWEPVPLNIDLCLRVFRVERETWEKAGDDADANTSLEAVDRWCEDGEAALVHLLSLPCRNAMAGWMGRKLEVASFEVLDLSDEELDRQKAQQRAGPDLTMLAELGTDGLTLAVFHRLTWGEKGEDPQVWEGESTLLDGQTKLVYIEDQPDSSSVYLVYLTVDFFTPKTS